MFKTEQDLVELVKINFKKVERLDIEIPCSICEELVHISQLFHHKKIHKAQAVLGYQVPGVKYTDIKSISLRRKQLLFKLSKAVKFAARETEKIGCAFDLLKESFKTAPYFCINNVDQSSVHIKEVSNPLIQGVAICQDKNAVWHTDLEDVFIVLDNYGQRKDTCLLGLFDGSNGITAAQFTSDELPLLLLEQLSHNDPSYQLNESERNVLHSFHTVFRANYIIREKVFSTQDKLKKQKLPINSYEWIHKAYAKAFWRMDRLLRLGRGENSKVRWSSCTATICLIEKISNENQDQNQQGKKTLKTTNDNEEQDPKQHVEKQHVSERENIKEQQADQILDQKQEEPLGRINNEKDQNSIEQNSGLVTGQQEALAFSRVRDGKEQNSTEHKIYSITREQQESLETEMDVSERENIKEQQADQILDQKQEEPLGRINNKKDQNSIEQNSGLVTGQQEALALTRVRDGKEQNGTEHKTYSTTREQQESLGTEMDGETRTTEPEDKDEIQEEGSLDKDQSADEVIGLIHIANVGDVQAVLCKNGKSYWLTKEHSTYNRSEKIRVVWNGGYISSNEPAGLVGGLIPNTRGLGHHGNPKLKTTVIPVPNTITFQVDNSCQFLIIASSGLWEVLDKNEVVGLTFTLFSAYVAKYQFAQLIKTPIDDGTKEPSEDQVYSLYINKDIFDERDLDDLNASEESTETKFQSLPADEGTKEKSAHLSLTVSSEETLSESTDGISTSDTEGTYTETEKDYKSEELVLESYDFFEISEDSETDSISFYSRAAKYISKHLVKAALKAGSRNNVSVLLALLNGCVNIPTDSMSDVLMEKTE